MAKKSRFKKISETSKGKFKKISERSKSEFKPREGTGVKTGRGLAAPKQETRRRGSYVDYLRGMGGRNKSLPLTPEQFKKQGRL